MHRTTSAAIQGQLGVVNSRVAVPARVATSLAHLRAAPSSRRADRRGPVQTVAWGGLKKLGLQKPSWLPDFGASKRKQLLLTFFSGIDRQRYEDLLAPDFLQVEEGMRHIKSYGREGGQKL